jgi:hypothetical protein
MPADLVKAAGRLKIHDWAWLVGAPLAYMFMQFEGVGDDHKRLLYDYSYALEVVTFKSFSHAELPGQQTAIDLVLADAEAMLPVFFASTITRRQLNYFSKQVTPGGPAGAHGMLDVEGYNVFLKKWSRSRKNLAAGLIRNNALVQEVPSRFTPASFPPTQAWFDSLSSEILQPPDVMSKTHVHRYGGKSIERIRNDQAFFHALVELATDSGFPVDPVRVVLFC